MNPVDPGKQIPKQWVAGFGQGFREAGEGGSMATTTGGLITRKGICGVCPAGCWVEADLRDGALEAIRPDRSHPLGQICRRGEHAAEIVYSPHRLRHPMRRTGPKGTHGFERISWDAAYDLIVERLHAIKDTSGPEAVAIYTGRGAFELSLCDIFQPKGVAVSSASSVRALRLPCVWARAPRDRVASQNGLPSTSGGR